MNGVKQGARTIYKYKLIRQVQQDVHFANNPKILSVQMQCGEITLWAEVDLEVEKFGPIKTIFIVGTGHPLPEAPTRYIGTVQDIAGAAWHIYEAMVA